MGYDVAWLGALKHVMDVSVCLRQLGDCFCWGSTGVSRILCGYCHGDGGSGVGDGCGDCRCRCLCGCVQGLLGEVPGAKDVFSFLQSRSYSPDREGFILGDIFADGATRSP